MTQNQLKYWELRWKQHYESLYLEIQKEQTRIDAARVAETARHNRQTERIEKQRLVQENVRLSQKQVELAQVWKRIEHESVKISQDWAKLAQEERANMVKYAIEAYKADIQLTEIQNKFLVDMGKLQVAEQETALAAMEASAENDRKWFENVVKMGKEAFGLEIEVPKNVPLIGGSKASINPGSAIAGLLYGTSQLVRKWLPNEFDNYQSNLKQIASTTLEHYGPQAGAKMTDFVSKTYDMIKNPKHTSPNISRLEKEEKDTVSGHSNTDHHSKGTSIISPETGKYYKNHQDAGSTKSAVVTETGSGTSVIYSPGSHYGPGFMKGR